MRHSRLVTSAFAVTALICASFTVFQEPQEDQAQKRLETKVRTLMEVTGAADMGKQVMDQMLGSFGSMPGLPPGFIEKFKELAEPEKLVDLVVPIQMRSLDEKTVDATIEFMRSDAGRKYTAAQPKIAEESMAAGQKWGQGLAMKVMAELDR